MTAAASLKRTGRGRSPVPRVGRGDIKPRRIEGHFVDAVSGLRPVLYHDQLFFT